MNCGTLRGQGRPHVATRRARWRRRRRARRRWSGADGVRDDARRRGARGRRGGGRRRARVRWCAASMMSMSMGCWRWRMMRCARARAMTRGDGGAREGHGSNRNVVTYSPKVFVPVTKTCRDSCGYCAFVEAPSRTRRANYMTLEEIVNVARAGARAGATECLLTLGDRPEAKYVEVREELKEIFGGREDGSTAEYVALAADAVLKETGLIPHVNAGILTRDELRALRRVSASQGLMLETTSERLLLPGEAHFECDTKKPRARLRAIELAGEERIPFTSGLLVGIGETRRERIESLFALKRLHDKYGHIQELIIQNFLSKPNTAMASRPDCPLEELTWTVAMARVIFGAEMVIQAPPNLTPGQEDGWRALLRSGLNDWGGISPGVTPDFVNAEAPWPHVEELARLCHDEGYTLVPRLPVHPTYLRVDDKRTSVGGSPVWLDDHVAPFVRRLADAEFLARGVSWSPGRPESELKKESVDIVGVNGGVPFRRTSKDPSTCIISHDVRAALDALASADQAFTDDDIVTCLQARGDDFDAVCSAADALRKEQCGDIVSFANNRNINYTNICTLACTFCSFSKGKTRAEEVELRGNPYLLDFDEVSRRTAEAWARGATEVCMQGGIHPSFTGEDYLGFIRAAKAGAPDIHVHAFSPLEISHGAQTMKMTTREYLKLLFDAGLGSLPGTAAEVLDDEVRKTLCPDKLTAAEWLQVVEDAHSVGVPTTSTIMFGHIDADGPHAWARHLRSIRDLHARTHGFTEFVPLPFVHFEAPAYRSGNSRKGPTLRECVLMHAVARLVLGPVGIKNIQASWVKMGPELASHLLHAGCNDMGGTLMNESITRAAGATFGQEIDSTRMREIIASAGRIPRQRTTLYADVTTVVP